MEVEGKIRALLELDFQLTYLVVLTREGVKPLSRWEKTIDRDRIRLIEELGLALRSIPRRVQSGATIREYIFSRSEDMLQEYCEAFSGKMIDKSPETRSKEGILFGYPRCCVEHFIVKPYDRNRLDPEDQSMLFHWACTDCRATAKLLSRYRKIHRWLKELECEAAPRCEGPGGCHGCPGLA